MLKVDRPTGLIAYETDDNIDRFQAGEKPRYRFVRIRTLVYAVALVLVAAVMLAGLLNRSELELNAARDRNPNYVRLSDGAIRNGYTIKVVNKANAPRELELMVEGDPELIVRLLGTSDDAPMRMTVEAGRTRDFVIYLTLPPGAIDVPREAIMFRVLDPATGESAQTRSVLVTGLVE